MRATLGARPGFRSTTNREDDGAGPPGPSGVRHRLSEDGPQRRGVGPSWITEIDLVVLPVHGEAVLRDELVVHASQQLRLVVVRADVECLDAASLRQGLHADLVESRGWLLRA